MANITPTPGKQLGNDHLKQHQVYNCDEHAPANSITVDANGDPHYANRSSFWAKAGAQSIPSGVATTVEFDDVESNVGGNYNGTTSRYTADATMLHLFTAGIIYNTNAALKMDVNLHINGTLVQRAAFGKTEAPESGGTATFIVPLTAGDTVEIRTWQDTGTSQALLVEGSYFAGVKLI